MYDKRNPKPVFCDNLKGQGEEGGGREVQEGGKTRKPLAYGHMLMYGRGLQFPSLCKSF